MRKERWLALVIITLLVVTIQAPVVLAASARAFATATVTVVPKIENQADEYAHLYAQIPRISDNNVQYKYDRELDLQNSGQEKEPTLTISETL